MTHADPKRQGSEKGQRAHAGRTSARSDAGLQSHSQGARGKGPMPAEGAGDEALRGASDEPRGVAAPDVRTDRDAGLADTGMDRDAGAGAAGGRDASAAPKGRQRDLERGGEMASRGLEASGDARARSEGQRPLPPRGGKADRNR